MLEACNITSGIDVLVIAGETVATTKVVQIIVFVEIVIDKVLLRYLVEHISFRLNSGKFSCCHNSKST